MTAVAVVGAGVVSPAGSTIRDFWSALTQATGTLASTVTYPPLGLSVPACRASGFAPADRYPAHELRRLDRSHQMALWAADDAMAGLEGHTDPARSAIVVGVGYGAAGFAETQTQALAERGWRAVSPMTIPVVMPNSIAAHLALRFGCTGPTITVAAACASGAVAIGEGMWLIRSGRADRVLCGGVDSLHTPGVTAFFHRMDALSQGSADPTRASRPFDVSRDGFVLSEGAGFVVLERHPARKPIGHMLGYATNNDSHNLVAPPPDGNGARDCMIAALTDAGIMADEIGHVNAHGTSTRLNDAAEAHALAGILPLDVPVFAPKSILGHAIGAAGALEAIISLLAIAHQSVPGTVNYDHSDPTMPAIAMQCESRPVTHSFGLTNSFAFGGINATLVVTA